MRIGISTSVIQRGKTGIAQYIFALLRAFLPHANEHRFFLCVLEEDLAFFDFAKDHMEIVRVPERARPPLKNIVWHQTKLRRLARLHGLDVLHIPSYRRILWSAPCARVATIHDLAPYHVSKKYDWKRMLYARLIVKRLARRQNQIIAISQNTARDIATCFRLPDERVTVIHNGLDHERFTPGTRDEAKMKIAQRFGLKRPFFLYVARIEHPGKNHVRLISAFERFKAQSGSNW